LQLRRDLLDEGVVRKARNGAKTCYWGMGVVKRMRVELRYGFD
jgi:hypothetical protein